MVIPIAAMKSQMQLMIGNWRTLNASPL